MDRRREKKLCFECGLPGHQAASHQKNKKPWKGRKQQLKATGRSSYNEARQLCVAQKGGTNAAKRDLEESFESAQDVMAFEDTLTDSDDDWYPESEGEPESSRTIRQEDSKPATAAVGAVIASGPIEPKVGERWLVTQYEELTPHFRTREWQLVGTTVSYHEPGDIPVGPPNWGEEYEVVYKDEKRIGWRQVNGATCYIQFLPLEPKNP